ncbi:MAG TPA: ribulose bisphosphate carboxylase small subunit [Alphaproteobacteria bacterium]|nr:ribulose bisphosphate carboxylase small subunit [Alphaproteobacteria bacterium]
MQRFETFAFLPPLSNAQIEAQAHTLIANGWVASIEFSETPTHADFYWRQWPILPTRFGAEGQPQALTAGQLMAHVESCARRHPYAFVKLNGYNPVTRLTEMSFIAKTPQEGQ